MDSKIFFSVIFDPKNKLNSNLLRMGPSSKTGSNFGPTIIDKKLLKGEYRRMEKMIMMVHKCLNISSENAMSKLWNEKSKKKEEWNLDDDERSKKLIEPFEWSRTSTPRIIIKNIVKSIIFA